MKYGLVYRNRVSLSAQSDCVVDTGQPAVHGVQDDKKLFFFQKV
jgi:hypothetical protein